MSKCLKPYTDFGFKKLYTTYEQNLLDYWGVRAAVETARQKGREEGEQRRILIAARNMQKEGYEIATIAKLLDIAADRLAALLAQGADNRH